MCLRLKIFIQSTKDSIPSCINYSAISHRHSADRFSYKCHIHNYRSNTKVLLSSINQKLQANRSSFGDCDALGTKDMYHIGRNHILYSNVWPNCGRFRIFYRLLPSVLLAFLYCEWGITFWYLNFDWICNKEFIFFEGIKKSFSFA
jgi:hypothetical protein